MVLLEEKWGKIHHRLKMLAHADKQEEVAYENLVSAYQEARELNDEMEVLLKDALTS